MLLVTYITKICCGLTRLVVCMQRWQVALQLQEAEALAAVGDLHQACAVCQQALDLSIAVGLHVQPRTNASQVNPAVQTATACCRCAFYIADRDIDDVLVSLQIGMLGDCMYHCCCIQVLLCRHLGSRYIAAAIFAQTKRGTKRQTVCLPHTGQHWKAVVAPVGVQKAHIR